MTKITVWKLLGYGIGGLFVLSGLGNLLIGHWHGLILILAGALLLPMARRRLAERHDVELSGGATFAIVVALFFVFGAANLAAQPGETLVDEQVSGVQVYDVDLEQGQHVQLTVTIESGAVAVVGLAPEDGNETVFLTTVEFTERTIEATIQETATHRLAVEPDGVAHVKLVAYDEPPE